MNLLIRLYVLMIRAYPAQFRKDYEHEMKLAFADMLRDARDQNGIWGIMAVAIGVYLDLVRSATRERLGAAGVGEKAIWALALLGMTTLIVVSHCASQAQAPMLVLIVTTVLLGAYDPTRAWRWGVLMGASIPIFDLIRMGLHLAPYTSQVFTEFEIIPLALLFTGTGLCARSVLANLENQARLPRRSKRISLCLSAFLAGSAMGICDFTLISPIFVIVGLVTVGILLGSFNSEPILFAAWVGFGVPVAIVFEMAMRQQPFRHHYVLIDALAILWCAGSALLASQVRQALSKAPHPSPPSV